MSRLEDQLLIHEEYRRFPYKDSVGILTVAVGRNLDDVGISKNEALYLLANDVLKARNECVRTFTWFDDLDDVRQDAIVNMCFNMGINRLKTFRKMARAFSEKDYDEAAQQALDSKWANQVGRRSEDIIYMFITGEYP